MNDKHNRKKKKKHEKSYQHKNRNVRRLIAMSCAIERIYYTRTSFYCRPPTRQSPDRVSSSVWGPLRISLCRAISHRAVLVLSFSVATARDSIQLQFCKRPLQTHELTKHSIRQMSRNSSKNGILEFSKSKIVLFFEKNNNHKQVTLATIITWFRHLKKKRYKYCFIVYEVWNIKFWFFLKKIWECNFHF